MNNRRIACIDFPDFPLELYFKLRPALRIRSVALVDEEGETALITARNEPASHYDIATGMTVAQANSLCSGLIIGVRDLDRERAVLQRIHRLLKAVGPDIEPGDNAVLFLESSRLNKLYRDEPGIARKILTVLQPLGYPVTIGFAVNKFVARTAARHADRNRWLIVPSGAEGAWLRKLHVEQLALSDDTAEILFDLGIATLGQAASLPVNEIVQRFGTEGVTIARRARGDDSEPFLPEQPKEDHHETVILDHPIRDTNAILTHAEAMLNRLLIHLRRTGHGTCEAQVRLHLDNRTERVFKIAVEKPSLSTTLYMRQMRLSLEQLRLEAPVRDITIRIPRTATLLLEQTAFERPGDNEALDPQTAETISRTLSGNSLCTAILSPAHLPERHFHLIPMTPSASTPPPAKPTSDLTSSANPFATGPLPYSLHRINGLRLLHPPRPTEVHAPDSVLCDESGQHRVTARKGPWKLSGDWWQSGFDRLYYELNTDGNRRYLVFFDRHTSRWFLQGVYD